MSEITLDKPRCQKCSNLLSKQDLISVPSGKYCAYCACRVYRYVISNISEERDRWKSQYEKLASKLKEAL